MKLYNRFIAFATLIAAGAMTMSADVTDWYPETVENRPFTRWWWLGSAVDPEGLTFNLEEFAKKGMGGVEITPIYGVQGNEANDIIYLSPKWMDMLAYTIKEGDRLGLQIDMNNGTGWPFGGPEITTDESAQKQIIETWNLQGGKKLKEKIRVNDPRQQKVATLQAVVAANGDKRIDVTKYVGKDSLLNWKAPKGDWKIYALFSGRTFQKVKRAAPGGEGYVLNHYDSIAVKNYLAKFDRAFEGRDNILPNTFFNDSYEVYGSDWTKNYSMSSSVNTVTSSSFICRNLPLPTSTPTSAHVCSETTAAPSVGCCMRTSPRFGLTGQIKRGRAYATSRTVHLPTSSTFMPRSTSPNANPSVRPTLTFPDLYATEPPVRATPTLRCLNLHPLQPM